MISIKLTSRINTEIKIFDNNACSQCYVDQEGSYSYCVVEQSM